MPEEIICYELRRNVCLPDNSKKTKYVKDGLPAKVLNNGRGKQITVILSVDQELSCVIQPECNAMLFEKQGKNHIRLLRTDSYKDFGKDASSHRWESNFLSHAAA